MTAKLVVESWELARADAYAGLLRQVVTAGVDGAEQVEALSASWAEASEPALRAMAYAMYRALTVAMPWVDFTPGASWVAYDVAHTQPQYRMLPWGDWELRGMLKLGTVGSGVLVTLPAGAAPRLATNFPVLTDSGLGRFELYSDGTGVVLSGGNGFLVLDGVRWSTQ